MAKKLSLPKKVAGVKIPKALRRSKMLRSLLKNDVGRKIVADALMAGASAAAAALVARSEAASDAADATAGVAGAAKRRGSDASHRVGHAIEDASHAILGVIGEAARSLTSKDAKDHKGGGEGPDGGRPSLMKPGKPMRRRRAGGRGGLLHRLAIAGLLSALAVLVRKHPRAAIHMVGAGVAGAGREGWREMRETAADARKKQPGGEHPRAAPPSRDELRRLRRYLDDLGAR